MRREQAGRQKGRNVPAHVPPGTQLLNQHQVIRVVGDAVEVDEVRVV